jgi:gliding motility-associated-like protein
MKRIAAFILIVFSGLTSYANHITGGEMFYTLTSQVGNDYTYHVTLKLYRDPNSGGAQLDNSAGITVFDRFTGTLIQNNPTVPLTRVENLLLTTPNPCIVNPPLVQYQVGYYEFDITLPGSANGYMISYQRCCRINGITNILGSVNTGATYTAEIPGTSGRPDGPANNSARFVGPDTVVVCANNTFIYSFAAIDPDAPTDVLNYSFCNGYPGGGPSQGSGPGNNTPNPASPPPYPSLNYSGGGFTGTSPLGSTIAIDPNTGLITGIAPAAGIYVVTVCVTETRNGVVIATQRKDLQIKISDCQLAAANLGPDAVTCDGFNFNFFNGGDQSLIHSYNWTFGDPASGANDSSNLATPTHVFTDTGRYVIQLITNRGGQCSDTGYKVLGVYPGFFPGFTTTGICYLNAVQFNDTTNTQYGFVNSWSWNFGDATTLADTSHLQNPQWTYGSPGTKPINFIVTNSKGCRDTVNTTIDLIDKPPLSVAFADTLICIVDNVQLEAIGTGNFTWTSTQPMTNANTATPTADPNVTAYYYVQLENGGCINRDSVLVRVLTVVALRARADTTICLTDSIRLNATTDGLTYLWTQTPAGGTISDPTILNPWVRPANGSTTYEITSSVGSCSNTDQVTVTAIPYPVANAGPDTTICFNTAGQLFGSHNGVSFNWSPTTYMTNPTSLTPTVAPPRSQPYTYVLSAFANAGCPKAGRDTVIVTVLPKIRPFAGRDTAVIVGQPLQFEGSGGVTYLWRPPTGLSDINIHNPVGMYDGSIDSIRYTLEVFNEKGCSDSAFVTVKVFKTVPSIFVPTGFTPNNDGLNDVIRPIAVGMQEIKWFRIYNRWGQLVFSTTINGHGWDGKINGVPQSTNTFVWQVSAVDYLGKPYYQKGHVTLIR